jgi:hypothetical protein
MVHHAHTVLEMGNKFSTNFLEREGNLNVKSLSKYCIILRELDKIIPLVDDVYNYVKEEKIKIQQ